MKLNFKYDKEKDIWCLLNFGKKSGNSGLTTKVYDRLVSTYGENPTHEEVSEFIDKYISENNLYIQKFLSEYENDWNKIAEEYQKRAERIFGVSLPYEEITAYLTINNRCPYDKVNHKYFFVSMSTLQSIRKTTAMHELWHFYTWYAFGSGSEEEEERFGKQKYNDIKEALTVLLNIECKDLLPLGVEDKGYPQHEEMRQKITEMWSEGKNMKEIVAFLGL